MISKLFWIVPVASVTALLFAWIFFKSLMKKSEGNQIVDELIPKKEEYLNSQELVSECKQQGSYGDGAPYRHAPGKGRLEISPKHQFLKNRSHQDCQHKKASNPIS